nr:putative protein SSX6 [Cavia porcellus]
MRYLGGTVGCPDSGVERQAAIAVLSRLVRGRYHESDVRDKGQRGTSHTVARVMNTDSSFAKSPTENTVKPQKKYRAFADISKYFSRNQWKKMSYSDKVTCVYLKRNYTTMTRLGLRVSLPTFMRGHERDVPTDDPHEGSSRGAQDNPAKRTQKRPKMPKKPAKKSHDVKIELEDEPEDEQALRAQCASGEASTSGRNDSEIPGFRQRMVSSWDSRLRERTNRVVYEEISDPEEEA